jgi:hypothetical protein
MRRRWSRLGLAVAILVQGLWIQPLGAQPTPADKAAADALFRQGEKLLKEQNYAEACAKLDASFKLDPVPGTLLFLGECYERVGKTASAWRTFTKASELAQRENDTKRKGIADVRASALAPRVSRLTIRVAPANAIEGFVLRRNGIEVPREEWGKAIETDAGGQKLEASAPGKKPWEGAIAVSDGGQTFTIDVGELAPLEGPPPDRPLPDRPEPPTPQPASSGLGPMQISGIVIGGVGLVGVIVGGVFGGLAKSSNDESLEPENCRTATLCSPTGIELREEAQDRALGSTIAFAVGGVLLAGGIALIVIPYAIGPSEGASGLFVAPTVGPHGAGTTLGGRF